jgi:CHAT domain-containing protein/Flp pilus assembly protein TadD
MAVVFKNLIQKTLEPLYLAKSIYNVNVAGFYLAFGNTKKSLYLNEFARDKLTNKNGWKVTTARCYNNLAKTYYNLGEYENAVKLFKSARKIFKQKNKQIYVALCETNMGHAYFKLDRYEEALDLYLSARKIFQTKEQPEYAANLEMELATVYSSLEQFEKAVDLIRSARATLAKKKSWKVETAHCDINLAKIYTQHGQNENAMESNLSARKIFLELGNKFDVAKCEMDLAVTYLKGGRSELALESFKSAKKLFAQLSKPVEIAEGELNMARIYFDFFQYDKSLQLIESARKTFHDNDLYGQVAFCDIETVRIFSSLGNFEKALELNQSARKLLENNKEKILRKDLIEKGIASCDFNTANIYYRTGEYEIALTKYESIREDLARRGLGDELINCNFNIACVNLFLGNYDQAFKLFETIRKEYADRDLITDVDLCDLNMAAAYMILGDQERAFDLFKKVNNSDNLNLKAKSLFGIGKLYWRQGNYQQAKSYCESAIEEIENIRESTSQDDLRTSFLGTVFDFYYMIIEICLQLDDFKAAYKYLERLKSRSLAEMLANRDLLPKNATRDERQEYKQLRSKIRSYSNLLNKVKNPVRIQALTEELKQLEKEYEQMVARLKEKDSSFDPDHRTTVSYSDIKGLIADDETAIIEFFPMDDRVVAFVIKNDQDIDDSSVIIAGYNRFKLNGIISELLKLYKNYQESSGSKKSQAKKLWEDYLERTLKKLYDKIFLKIQPRLNGIKKIVLIPYSQLHFLPLHAMFYENNGCKRYIIDDYIVSYAPSAQILKLCQQRSRKNNGKIILAHANPQFKNHRLAHSQKEINAINDLFEESEIINSATRSDIIQSGKTANILHYTGHAHRRALILHNEEDLATKEEYWLEDIFESLYLPEADLVTLSACETGMILPKGVDEHFGLSSGLMNAGALTVIASLWTVSDASTSLLMRKMYELIKQGMGKAEALREAQLWLKNPDNSREHREMFNGNKNILYDQHRGFAVDSSNWEEILPNDLHRSYHWAGFICSGV